MFFKSFSDVFPDLKEVKRLTAKSVKGLPDGEYLFAEMYCTDKACDCRKVIITIVSDVFKSPIARMHYGWESQSYYSSIFKNPEIARDVIGFSLETLNGKEEMGEFFLTTVEDLIANDKSYKDRIIRHYFMFKRSLVEGGFPLAVDEIISNLEYFHGYFPKNELEQAIKVKDEITPKLLNCLEKAIKEYEDLEEGYWLHIYSTFLLGELREKEAFPLLIKLLSLPGEYSDRLFGDAIAEDMDHILASTYDGDLDSLKKLVENKDVDQFCRDAALRAIAVLVNEKVLPSNTLTDYLKYLLTEGLDRNNDKSFIWASIALIIIDFGIVEVKDLVLETYDIGLIDKQVMFRDEIEDVLLHGKSNRHWSEKYKFFDGAIKHLQHWASFTESKVKLPTYIQKVGRNEPCLCGSGKKFKKCCLNKKLVAV